MKKAIIVIAIFAAVIFSIGGISQYNKHQENVRLEEREKFTDTLASFEGIIEEGIPEYLEDIEYYESAEVEAEAYLQPWTYEDDKYTWVEHISVTAHLDNTFDSCSEEEIFDELTQIKNTSSQAIAKIKKDNLQEYTGYMKYAEDQFPGYTKEEIHYSSYYKFYAVTDTNTYQYSEPATEGVLAGDRFYWVNGHINLVHDDWEYSSGSSSGGNGRSSGSSSSGSSGRSSHQSSSNTENKSTEVYEDEYGVNDYDDPEDFYEAFEDDFEDEEDAEDYYDEYHD